LPAVILALMVSCASEPVANFDFESDSEYAPAQVTFTNRSTDASNFRWDFGDQTSSTEKNPVHTYTGPGTFEVTLVAKGSGGEASLSKTITIDQRTTYFLRNQLSGSMYNVISYHWDGDNVDELIEHGQLSSGAESEEIPTQYTRIYVEFQDADGFYYYTPGWNLTRNARNAINITQSQVVQFTTYIVRNQVTFPLYNVISFEWEGGEIQVQEDLGTINAGGQSDEIITTYLAVDLYLESPEGTGYYTNLWMLTENSRNYINITSETEIVEASIEQLQGMSREAARELLNSGKTVKLGDIMN